MDYKLIITKTAEDQIDNIVGYVAKVLNNVTAAKSILSDIELAYTKLENSAEIFPYCNDSYLEGRGYRKINLKRHDYVIIYRVEETRVYILGVFHMKENYGSKI